MRVIDNSAIGKQAMMEGKPPKCIHVYRKCNQRIGYLGDRILVAIKGQMMKGVVVGLKAPQKHGVLRTDSNNMILLDKNGNPADKEGVFLNTPLFHAEEVLIDAHLGRRQDGQGVIIQASPKDSALKARELLDDGEGLLNERPDVAAGPVPATGRWTDRRRRAVGLMLDGIQQWDLPSASPSEESLAPWMSSCEEFRSTLYTCSLEYTGL
ncbi:MRPL14 [Cordylochernes scorpioides]|uniref:Large ribosomal subunit protein uL14m n=1 Tax=Cordylochernes scorpioides TaxID=51811 RepID=A0ABY6KN03_9ARAC|nr:MRPL14 [Cordylochernes scorpioides]